MPIAATTTPPIAQQHRAFQGQNHTLQQSNSQITKTKPTVNSKAWLHLVAGGVGGMMGAIVTCPLDVVKTRLQSSFYSSILVPTQTPPSTLPILGRFVDTGRLLGTIYRGEGWKALFKGLGPNLVGVIPARSIYFFTYGNGKRILTDLNGGQETSLVHSTAAISAGITTSTVTNPIWLVKTRMQLQTFNEHLLFPVKKYKNSLDCVIKVIREEGFKGLYKGLSASYLGVAEGTIQWVTYEYLKRSFSKRRNNQTAESDDLETLVSKKNYWHLLDNLAAAGSAKLIAAGLQQQYSGLFQCARTIIRHEGMTAMYGGLTAHLMRVVPNAATMFFCYEMILHYGGLNEKDNISMFIDAALLADINDPHPHHSTLIEPKKICGKRDVPPISLHSRS
ncbi:hypothetical protein G9A89_005972 [Geosiphon pyriformis]|nr:hypothetical protein G9A89_005972 [Geosiphon pyriformis]